MKKTLLTISTVILSGMALAQNPGDLDLNFGIGGYAMSDPIANTGELYWDLITLANDKIVKVGFTDDGGDSDILIARLKPDGTPDSTFATNGFLVIDMSLGGNEDARGVYELASGQLLVTGFVQTMASYDAYVMRVNEDGTIDASFGTAMGHTKLNTGDNLIAYGKSVLEYGGEIFVGGAAINGGQSDLFVCNLTGAGGVDVSFSSGGYALMDLEGGNDHMMSMDVQSNGAFVFGGYADSSGTTIGYVASMSQFGTPTTFGTNGSFHVNFQNGANEVNDLYVDANNNVVFVGDEGTYPNVNGFLMRLTPAGALDVSFANNGLMMSDPGATTALFFRGVTETLDGGIMACGNFDGASQDLYAMLVDDQGSLNGNFGGNGDVIIPFAISTNMVAVMGCGMQSDGKVVVGGYLTSQDFVGENMFAIRIIPFAGLGIEELATESVTVYPNPVTSEFQVSNENVKSVELLDLSGNLIETWDVQLSYTVPNSLTTGVYLVRVTTENSIGVARIMVK